MDAELTEQLIRSYPALRDLPAATWRTLLQDQRVVHLPQGKVVFQRGKRCEYFPLLLDGSVRIQRLSNDGHEITLRHVHAGETCELATVCLLAGNCYPVEAVVEAPIRAILLNKAQFTELIACAPFKEYIFSSLHTGLESLLGLVEDIAFGPLDRRLAHCLLHLAENDEVRHTHVEIAQELGTAREVVSRLLKDFERREWVELHRGRIVICDQLSLRAAAIGPVM